MQSIFFEISIVLIVGTLFATLAKFFRQPLIPAYIIAGVVLGPPLLHIIRSGELLHALSTFGIAFLLFLVGIELDLRKFLKTSRVAIIVALVFKIHQCYFFNCFSNIFKLFDSHFNLFV